MGVNIYSSNNHDNYRINVIGENDNNNGRTKTTWIQISRERGLIYGTLRPISLSLVRTRSQIHMSSIQCLPVCLYNVVSFCLFTFLYVHLLAILSFYTIHTFLSHIQYISICQYAYIYFSISTSMYVWKCVN